MNDIYISLAVSLGLTLIIELSFALIMGVRGQDLLLVTLVNVVTNPVVVLLNAIFSRETNLPPVVYVLALELFAVITEAVFYKHRAVSIRKPYLFSVEANALSYGLGLVFGMIF